MSSITGYTQGFGEGTRTYNIFDIDSAAFAAAAADPNHDLIQISPNWSMAPEQRNWDFYVIDFTAQGIRDLLGDISTLHSNIMPISDYNSSGFNPEEQNAMITLAWHQPDSGPSLPLPPDWGDQTFGGWAYKYCTINGTTGRLRPSFFGDYYTAEQLIAQGIDSVYITRDTYNFMFWSSDASQIGVSHCWRYTSLGELQEYVRFFRNANSGGYIDSKTLGPYFVANDGSLTVIFDSSAHPIEVNHANSAAPRITVNWFAVNWNNQPYIGMVAIDHNAQGVPITGKGFLVANSYLSFNFEEVYNPTTSTPDHGIGHGIQDSQQFPGTNIGTNFDTGIGQVSPTSAGLKLVKMNLATLNEATNEFIQSPGAAHTISDARLALLSDMVLDVYALPFNIGATTSAHILNIGGIECEVEGDVGYGISQQFIQDMGSIYIPEPYGNYLDYEPYTTAVVGLPFCGVFEIPVNSFMNGELHLYYSVDVISGGCTAYLFGMDRNGRWHLIGQFAGQTKLQIPYAASAANITAMWNTLAGYTRGMTKIATGAAKIAAAGAGGGGAASTGVNLSKEAVSTTSHFNVSQGLQGGSGIAGGIDDIVRTTAYNDSQPKVCTEVLGEIGGAAGWNSFSIPFVRLKRVVWMPPEDQQKEEGMPANIRYTLNDFAASSTGLCRARNPKLNIENANEQELAEIQTILASGFYVK